MRDPYIHAGGTYSTLAPYENSAPVDTRFVGMRFA